jgi:hypothetical protein
MKKNFTLLLLIASLKTMSQPCIPNTNSIQFDGFSSEVSISPQNGFDIISSITIEAWINPASFGFDQAQNSIVCKHGWSSGEGGYVIRCGGSGELSFNIAGLDTDQVPVSWVEVISPVNVLSLNTWAHVAGTFDGNQLILYVNGNVVNTLSFAGSIVPSPSYPLAIGRLSDPVWGPARYFDGLMDEVRVWNRALSQAELQAGMNDHIDPASATGLISCWRMNEGANATLNDIAGSNNGGMIFCNWSTQVPFNSVPPTPVITYMNDTLYSSAPAGNQWYLDGNAIGGATQIFFLPQQNGIYTVEVTNIQNCTAMSAAITLTDVSVAEQSNSSIHLSIYPNPFHEKGTIEISSSKEGMGTLIIRDLCGRMVRQISSIEIGFVHKKIPLERNDLDNGIYFYEVCIAGKPSGTGMFILN